MSKNYCETSNGHRLQTMHILFFCRSTSGLKGILKHRQRRKSEGNVSSVNSPSQSGPDGFGERCTPVSIPRIDFDFNNVHVECIGEPTRRESVACLGNYDVPDHSLSAARWTTGRPWAEGTTNGGCASSFDVSAAVNRNVDFQLSHDVERPVLVVKYNGYCRDDVSRTSPSVVVTVCENGSTAGDGVVKVPIRTKKGYILLLFHIFVATTAYYASRFFLSGCKQLVLIHNICSF